MMIKLLVLCLLATVTMEDAHDADKSKEDIPPSHQPSPHPSTKTDADKSMEDTHTTHHPSPHPSTKSDAEKSMEDTHPTHPPSPHPSAKTGTEKSTEDTHPTHDSAPHSSAATDSKKTSENASHTGLPTAPLTCNCTAAGAGCHEHQCTTEESKRFCVTTAEENTLTRTQSTSVNRTCGDNADICNKTISITLSEGIYWRSTTTCCHDADHCNSLPLKPPPANTTQSKLVCPSCFGVNVSHCTAIPKKCAASETSCIKISGTVENGTSSITFIGQGCASIPANSIQNGTTLFFGNDAYHFTRIITMTYVKDGASQTLRSVPFTLLLSSFVGLLQAKFIY